MAEATMSPRVDTNNFKLTDIIVPCAATITAASFLTKTMDLTPVMAKVLYYMACGVIIMSFLAIVSLLIKYFVNPKTGR